MINEKTSLKKNKSTKKEIDLEKESVLLSTIQNDQLDIESNVEVCPPDGKYHLSYKLSRLPDSLTIEIQKLSTI